MAGVVETIVPVFGLIALGYAAGRSGYVSEAATKGLPEFVFRIAMPLMLFKTVGSARFPDVPPTRVLAAFLGAALIVWIATAVVARLFGRSQQDAAALSMAATFSNSVMLGIPIALGHFGPAAAPYVALIVMTDTAALWLIGTTHLALAGGGGLGFWRQVRAVFVRLVTNPIILGCVAGLAWNLAGVALPPLVDRMVQMLAAAAIPGALVTMGLALNSYGFGGRPGLVGCIVVLKLLVKPALAFLIADAVFGLPAIAVAVVTLLAAMPVGGNAYLFAAAYQREEGIVSGTIAVSTPLAMLTLSLLLLWLPGHS